MKSFVYTIEVVRRPRDGSGIVKRVTVWRVKRNEVQVPPLAREEYTFKDDFQAALEALQTLKPNPLPREAYATHPHTGSFKHAPGWAMARDGIARMKQI